MLNKPTLGMRTVKTMLATGVCALIYYFIGRNPAFACIGVVFGMGRDMADAFRSGFNRMIGTLIGGILGTALRWTHLQLVPDDHFSLWLVFLTFVGVTLLIILCQIFRAGGVHPGSIMLMVVMYNTHFEAYYIYAFNCMVDTVIGVTFAFAVTWLFPKDWLKIWPQRVRQWKGEKVTISD